MVNNSFIIMMLKYLYFCAFVNKLFIFVHLMNIPLNCRSLIINKEFLKNNNIIKLYKLVDKTNVKNLSEQLLSIHDDILSMFLNKNNTTFDDIIRECEKYINNMNNKEIVCLYKFITTIDTEWDIYLHIIKIVILYVLKKLGYNGMLSIIYVREAYKNLNDEQNKKCLTINAHKDNMEHYINFTRLDEKIIQMVYNFKPFYINNNECIFYHGMKAWKTGNPAHFNLVFVLYGPMGSMNIYIKRLMELVIKYWK